MNALTVSVIVVGFDATLFESVAIKVCSPGFNDVLQVHTPAALATAVQSGMPPSLTVTVLRTGKFHKVTSLESGAVKSTPGGDSLTVTLPLKNVDVLMIE